MVGEPETVAAGMAGFIDRYRPDELIVTAQVFDHAARLKSFAIAMDAAKALA